jgi:DNA-binding response OmpR family regulator
MASTIVSPSLPKKSVASSGVVEALNEREIVLLQTLLANQGRVVTRTELARAIGLRQQARRVDVHLVNVRRALDDRLLNIRGRGWMVPREFVLAAACQAVLQSHVVGCTSVEILEA